MIRNKKGIELAMSTIIAAALAVLVFVVIILILTGKISIFSTDTGSCKGKCVPAGTCDATSPFNKDCNAGEVCCLNRCPADTGACKPAATGCDQTAGEKKNAFFSCDTDQICCMKG